MGLCCIPPICSPVAPSVYAAGRQEFPLSVFRCPCHVDKKQKFACTHGRKNVLASSSVMFFGSFCSVPSPAAFREHCLCASLPPVEPGKHGKQGSAPMPIPETVPKPKKNLALCRVHIRDYTKLPKELLWSRISSPNIDSSSYNGTLFLCIWRALHGSS